MPNFNQAAEDLKVIDLCLHFWQPFPSPPRFAKLQLQSCQHTHGNNLGFVVEFVALHPRNCFIKMTTLPFHYLSFFSGSVASRLDSLQQGAFDLKFPISYMLIVVVRGSYLNEKTNEEKMGKYRSNNFCHLGLYFFCCGVNDRLGVTGSNAPYGMVQGYFWNFYF